MLETYMQDVIADEKTKLVTLSLDEDVAIAVKQLRNANIPIDRMISESIRPHLPALTQLAELLKENILVEHLREHLRVRSCGLTFHSPPDNLILCRDLCVSSMPVLFIM